MNGKSLVYYTNYYWWVSMFFWAFNEFMVVGEGNLGFAS
jgi:hypothetical protein